MRPATWIVRRKAEEDGHTNAHAYISISDSEESLDASQNRELLA